MLTAAGFNIKLIKQQTKKATKKDTENFKMQYWYSQAKSKIVSHQ